MVLRMVVFLPTGDYYEMHVGKSGGIHIEDVTKCGELILSETNSR
jgi:hypothetical protein